ncbi:ANTAR domain-containing protein [Streptomyces sp. NPDC102467]|uniref:ANTAR domain-containing protein n=1 Tax=Streptomyces sp. NPDC102467 TaxID=3366179 RepID=UPI00380AF7A2
MDEQLHRYAPTHERARKLVAATRELAARHQQLAIRHQQVLTAYRARLHAGARPAVRTPPPAPETADTEREALLREIQQLREAMTSRPVIDQARGILMVHAQCGPQAAWNILVEVSQRTNTKLRRIAEMIVTAHLEDHWPPGPGSIAEQVQACVARTTAADREPRGPER